MNKVAILCFSDYTKEPRVLRTIEALKDSYKIDIYSSVSNANSIDISRYDYDYITTVSNNYIINKIKSLTRVIKNGISSNNFFKEKYWSLGRLELLSQLKNKNYGLVIGHGIYSVPILSELSKTSKTIFNAHEYYEREFEENESWKKFTQPYYKYIVDQYLNDIHLMFCVCSTIENEYKKHFNINSVVINNARSFVDLFPINKSDSGKIKLVHHGAALRGRRLEMTIDVIYSLPDNYELSLILVSTDELYYNELLNKYKSESRIHFINSVKIEEIPALINQFDIGVYILPPTNYNNLVALPNKFFDFIQARLCLAVSPNIEMKNIIEQFDLGIVAKGFESKDLADAIKKLTSKDISTYKNNSHKHAQLLSADNNKTIIQNEVKKLLN